jgi:putative hydrolase of the HAD superfamily
VFDGDDTLWLTESLYDEARQQARAVVEAAGLDGARWEELERLLDVQNVQRLGLTLDRFPTSCIEAYRSLCSEAGRMIDPDVEIRVGAAARTAFEKPAPLVPNAREALSSLKSRGYLLALLTKGDPALQRRRIEQSGLAPFFDVIKIVDEKTPESIASVLSELGVAASSAVSVGNSLRSDITPSLAAGVQPIWIDAHVWEYERGDDATPDERVIAVKDLSRLLEVTS